MSERLMAWLSVLTTKAYWPQYALEIPWTAFWSRPRISALIPNDTVQPMRTIILGKLCYTEQSTMPFAFHRRTSPVANALTFDVSVDQF